MTTSTAHDPNDDEDEADLTRTGVEKKEWEDDVRGETVAEPNGSHEYIIYDRTFGENGWLKSDNSKRLEKMQ